jgi:hypothetical protein
MQRRLALLFVLLAAAGCRSTSESVPPSSTAGPSVQARSPSAPPAAPAQPGYESWPPLELRQQAPRRARAEEPKIRIDPKPGGYRVDELFEWIHSVTGRSILFDSANQTFKQARIEFVGVHEIPKSELFDWLQAVLSYRKLVLVPVGPEGTAGGSQWMIMDQADPNLKSKPVFVSENELADHASRDGLYITTMLRVRDTVDTTRVRNALSPLSTAIAGIGRIQDVPGARVLIVSDFAPVVWAMKQLLDRMNAIADRPEVGRTAPADAPTPDASKR